MIKYGEERGYINKDNLMKVHYDKESFWIKVIAIDRDAHQVIGILMNSLLDNELMIWGSIVLAEEIDVDKLCEVQYKVDCVPNTEIWTIL